LPKPEKNEVSRSKDNLKKQKVPARRCREMVSIGMKREIKQLKRDSI
jgi:hypothetical protein